MRGGSDEDQELVRGGGYARHQCWLDRQKNAWMCEPRNQPNLSECREHGSGGSYPRIDAHNASTLEHRRR